MGGRFVHGAALACAAAIGLCPAAAAGAATFVVETRVAAGPSGNATTRTQTTGPQDDFATLSDGGVYESGNRLHSSSAFTSGFAAAGILKSYSSAAGQSLPGPPPPGSAEGATGYGESRVEYRDSFILTSPGIAAGTVGWITADVFLDGVLGSSLYGANLTRGGALWRVDIEVNDSWVVYGRYVDGFLPDFPLTERGDLPGLKHPMFQVVFGQPNDVVIKLQTQASAGTVINFLGSSETRSAAFSSDFGSTLTWEGISKLTLGNVELTDFSAVSQTSGFDFRAGVGGGPAVPEPQTWAVMILGLGLTGAALRRSAAGFRRVDTLARG